MYLHTRVHAVDGRGPVIQQPWRRSPYNRNLAFQGLRRDAICEHIGKRYVAVAELSAAIRNKRAGRLVDRDCQRTNLEPLKACIALVQKPVSRIARLDLGKAQQRSHYRK